MQGSAALGKSYRKPSPHMKVLKAIIRLLVAGAFAAAEAVLLLDERPIARIWHRKHS